MRCRGIGRSRRCVPNMIALRSILPPRVLKVLPKQSKLPQLISDILPDVRHTPVRSHFFFVLIFFFFFLLYALCVLSFLCFSFFLLQIAPRHPPTPPHFPRRDKLNCAR